MNIFNLEGKTVLITGGSSGIGRGIAKTLSKVGVKVIITGRNQNKLNSITQDNPNLIAIKMDVTDKNSISNAIKNLEQRNIIIDICINSAGTNSDTLLFTGDDNNFEEVHNTNLFGVWNVTKQVSKHMKQNKIKGSIINISSVRGLNKFRSDMAAYCTSKAAVIQLTNTLVSELAEANIRINCIAPGLFKTPLTEHYIDTEEKKEEVRNNIPLKFIAEPEDMAGTILYLASNSASRYVTGACIVIDGGITSKSQ